MTLLADALAAREAAAKARDAAWDRLHGEPLTLPEKEEADRAYAAAWDALKAAAKLVGILSRKEARP